MLAGLYEEALGLELPYDMRLLYAHIDGQEPTAGTQNKVHKTCSVPSFCLPVVPSCKKKASGNLLSIKCVSFCTFFHQ
jgi:hypothetical protein